jgi:hypothetical protein
MEEIAMDDQRRILIQEKAKRLDEAYAETRRMEMESTQQIIESRTSIKEIVDQINSEASKVETDNQVDPWKQADSAFDAPGHPSGSYESFKPGAWQPKPGKRVV